MVKCFQIINFGNKTNAGKSVINKIFMFKPNYIDVA